MVAPYLRDIFSHIVDPAKILVLSNSVTIPAEIPRTFEKHRLLFLGRLCKEKGIGELLDAVAALRPDYPDLKLLDFTDSDDNFQVSEEEINIGISVSKNNPELTAAINEVLATLTVEDFNAMMDEAISVQPLSN